MSPVPSSHVIARTPALSCSKPASSCVPQARTTRSRSTIEPLYIHQQLSLCPLATWLWAVLLAYLHQLGHRGPLLRLRLQHGGDQVAQRLRHGARQRVVRAAGDVLAQRVQALVLLVEGVAQRHQLVQQAAQAPHVGREVVGRAADALGRHVVRRAHRGHRLQRARGEVARQPQVAQLEGAVSRHKDVAGLEVAVHHAPVVHVLHGVADLREEGPHLAGLEAAARRRALPQQVAQVARLGPLQDDDQLVVLDERVVALDDVGVLQALQDLDLLQAVHARLGVHHVKDGHLLHCHLHSCRYVSGCIYLGVFASPYQLVELIVSQ
mmetsp:Transcript_22262/g.56637  ORF Transcript_22262/g.56637 Transcript_22262/m.56637 type:complete len:323 (-) Transcript_22262:231-1199(-)